MPKNIFGYEAHVLLVKLLVWMFSMKRKAALIYELRTFSLHVQHKHVLAE
jgi:hypothetical protein